MCDKSEAYQEGFWDAINNKKRTNPYYLHTQERRDWYDGYDDIANEKKKWTQEMVEKYLTNNKKEES